MLPARGAALLQFLDSTHVRVGRRTLLYFAGCDYLGMSRHPGVLEAMRNTLDDGFTQPGASRATTGEHRLYRETERDLARFFRQPAAALVSCGYLAPLAAVQALRAQATHVLLADHAHACLKDAAAASGLPVHPFPQLDCQALQRLLKALGTAARPLLLTGGTFGTRGGMAPLDTYLRQLPAGGWLVVDDAHGAGAVGPDGRGAVAMFGLEDSRIVQTISLAKALGVAGGAVLGSTAIIEGLRQHAPAFVGSTAMPLAAAAGIRASIAVMRAEPGRIHRLQANMRLLRELLPTHSSLSNHSLTPVTAITPASPVKARRLRRSLLDAGIFPSVIRYLSGPTRGFFRLAVSAGHTEAEIRRLAQAVTLGLEITRCARSNS